MSLKPGSHLTSLYGTDIEIVKLLGSGGQGFVYKVLYGGEPKALKIYKPAALKDPKAFYENVKNNITKGSPSKAFLWPLDLLKWNGKTFGYIMDLRPDGYEELSSFLAGCVQFSSFKAIVTAALQIVAAFRVLHNKGYSYQDLNDGNFFIDPRNGNVLICDNDNVAPNGSHTGILGKPRYMAPEVVRGEKMPDTITDRFSLAVIIFTMLTKTHPLEGRRYLVPCLTAQVEEMLYGTEPLFVLDPDDKRNAPVAGTHKHIGIIWPELPGYMKDAFIREFSQEIMQKNPGHRKTEADWQRLLIRFRSDIIRCNKCGNENFSWDVSAPVCCACKQPISKFSYLELEGIDYPVPLIPGNIVYRVQFGTADVDKAGNPILYIRKHPQMPNQIIMHNVSGENLECITPSGNRKIIAHNSIIPANKGIQIRSFGSIAEVKE